MNRFILFPLLSIVALKKQVTENIFRNDIKYQNNSHYILNNQPFSELFTSIMQQMKHAKFSVTLR